LSPDLRRQNDTPYVARLDIDISKTANSEPANRSISKLSKHQTSAQVAKAQQNSKNQISKSKPAKISKSHNKATGRSGQRAFLI
jgi:hypothetical protein